MIGWMIALAACAVVTLVLVALVLNNTEKLLCQEKPSTLPQQPGGHTLKAVGEFPQFTSVFPVHWSRFPVENSEPGKQVVLPGAFGVGSQEEYKWIETWMLVDAALSEPRPGPLPHLSNLPVAQVRAGLEAYKLQSQVAGVGGVVSSAHLGDNSVVHLLT